MVEKEVDWSRIKFAGKKMGVQIGGHVEKVNGKELSYDEFVKKYMMKNQPVVLTGLIDDWRACRDWVDENGQPNLQFLSTHFGKSRVQVADCASREFTDQSREEMLVSDFIEQWPKDSSHNHVASSTNGTIGKSVLYLKDWHFVKEYPAYDAYTTPRFFCDDWLNLYLDCYSMHMDPNTCLENDDISCSDYRFVYMGAKGTWTPLHADVFRSYSWSANVCGKKRWVLLSPSQSHLVFDRNMKNCVYDVFEDVSKTKFPGFDKASWVECIQEQNEIIFVPSGWYHQVYNMEDTISINHNWFNAYNLSWVLDLLLRDYNEAKEYIEDIRDICDDFEGLCQRNLAANTGMNFYDYLILLARFALANVIQVCCLDRDYENGDGGSYPIIQHLALNLASIQNIALKMKSFMGLSGNQAVLVNLTEALTETKFIKLCEILSETYDAIQDQKNLSFRVKKVLTDGSETLDISRICDDRVCSPDDLASFIGNLFTKFRLA